MLTTAVAEKYKATMEFGGIASGTSEDVDAELTKGENGAYTISFIGFNATVQILGDVNSGSANITELKGTKSDSLVLEATSKSEFEFVGQSLSLTQFSATIKNGEGSGSFSGALAIPMFGTLTASCKFTLKEVVDADTIVTKELDFENVPFYNKAIDMSKPNDTTMTNNDSTSVGIQLFSQKATFVMSNFEISVGELALKQRMLLENLTYDINKTTEDIFISGKSNMYVEEYRMYLPAEVRLLVTKDNKISGEININVDLVSFKYQISVIFGEQAEGVVVETKTLEYEKTEYLTIKSDEAFVNDSVIYINDNGILIENIHYSIVDQTMTLLIKDYMVSSSYIDSDTYGRTYSNTGYKASKAEAYINVKGEIVYLKDVDIDFELTKHPNSSTSGQLTIVDGGSLTNKFLDYEAPIVVQDLIGGNIITMYVDTTGHNLDGYTEDSEFGISGIIDYVDGPIKSVKLADLDSARKSAIQSIKTSSLAQRSLVDVIATDAAGNSVVITATCYAIAAPVSIEGKAPVITPIKVIADSISGKATVTLEPIVINYYAKNDSLGLTEVVDSVVAEISFAGSVYNQTTTVELGVGKEPIVYIWNDIVTGEAKELSSTVNVYESQANMTKVANVANKAISVVYNNGNLIVNGVNDADVTVVNLSGATVYTGKAGSINLHKGIYIVKVNGKAHKIVVK